MIEKLTGTLEYKSADRIVMDVGGVGYGLAIPLPLFCSLQEIGQAVSLWVHTYVKEDQLRLFGFSSKEEKDSFCILLSIAGVGPKVALAILSTLSLGAIKEALLEGRADVFVAVPGIGKRTAEKILVELKTKADRIPGAAAKSSLGLSATDAEEDSAWVDALSALVNLGYKEKDVLKVLGQLKKSNRALDFNGLVRESLVVLTGSDKRGARSEAEEGTKSQTLTTGNEMQTIF